MQKNSVVGKAAENGAHLYSSEYVIKDKVQQSQTGEAGSLKFKVF